MALPIPTTEPKSFTAGETVKWTRAFGDYPASDGWTRKYCVRGASNVDILEVNGAFTLSAIAGKDLIAGPYRWTAYAEKGTEAAGTLERYQLDAGVLEVLPNFTDAGDGALLSHPEKALALIETQIEELLSSPIESYSISQRSAVRRKLAELRAERTRYKIEIQRAKAGGGRLPPYEFGFNRA